MKTILDGAKAITFKFLSDTFHDVYDAVKYVRENHLSYPDRPTKPRLQPTHSVADAKQYASDLEKYTKAELEYKRDCDIVSKVNSKMDEALEEFVKDMAGLKDIPEQYRDKVWSRAWDQSHSSGYGEVYGTLCSLVDIFK